MHTYVWMDEGFWVRIYLRFCIAAMGNMAKLVLMTKQNIATHSMQIGRAVIPSDLIYSKFYKINNQNSNRPARCILNLPTTFHLNNILI